MAWGCWGAGAAGAAAGGAGVAAGVWAGAWAAAIPGNTIKAASAAIMTINLYNIKFSFGNDELRLSKPDSATELLKR
jgi:hypothetical protein